MTGRKPPIVSSRTKSPSAGVDVSHQGHQETGKAKQTKAEQQRQPVRNKSKEQSAARSKQSQSIRTHANSLLCVCLPLMRLTRSPTHTQTTPVTLSPPSALHPHSARRHKKMGTKLSSINSDCYMGTWLIVQQHTESYHWAVQGACAHTRTVYSTHTTTHGLVHTPPSPHGPTRLSL